MRSSFIPLSVATLTVLAGCATPNATQLTISDLEKERFYVSEANFMGSFVDIQRTLNTNTEACGTHYTWRLESNEVHYANVVYQPYAQAPLSESVLVHLTHYSNGKLKAKSYTYLAETQSAAREVLKSLQQPSLCPSFPGRRTQP